jgi:hypothetical protein
MMMCRCVAGPTCWNTFDTCHLRRAHRCSPFRVTWQTKIWIPTLIWTSEYHVCDPPLRSPISIALCLSGSHRIIQGVREMPISPVTTTTYPTRRIWTSNPRPHTRAHAFPGKTRESDAPSPPKDPTELEGGDNNNARNFHHHPHLDLAKRPRTPMTRVGLLFRGRSARFSSRTSRCLLLLHRGDWVVGVRALL